MDPEEERCRNNSTKRICEHIFLSIPDITLTSKIRRASCRICAGSIDPLHKLVAHCNRGNHKDRICPQEESVHHEALCPQPLSDGIRIEPYRKVGHAVIVISLEAKKIRHPIERNLFKRIMPTNSMKKNEHTHQKICSSREANASHEEYHKTPHNDPHREILREPRCSINRTDCTD